MSIPEILRTIVTPDDGGLSLSFKSPTDRRFVEMGPCR
jgi:hypothetical protein